MSHPRVCNIRDFPQGRLPADVVRVSRPGRWGNHWRVGVICNVVHGEPALRHRPGLVLDRHAAVEHYRVSFELMARRWPQLYLAPLYGKRLACWCAPLECHAEVIMEFLEEWEGQQHGQG